MQVRWILKGFFCFNKQSGRKLRKEVLKWLTLPGTTNTQSLLTLFILGPCIEFSPPKESIWDIGIKLVFFNNKHV